MKVDGSEDVADINRLFTFTGIAFVDNLKSITASTANTLWTLSLGVNLRRKFDSHPYSIVNVQRHTVSIAAVSHAYFSESANQDLWPIDDAKATLDKSGSLWLIVQTSGLGYGVSIPSFSYQVNVLAINRQP